MVHKKDGLRGWVIVVAATICQTILGGICFSGGVFYVLFNENLGSDAVTTSWLCALPSAVWYLATPIGSLIINHHGYRVAAFIGGAVSALGLCLSFLVNNIGFLFFSYGTLIGLGFGINYTSCLTALNDYFDKYKAIATGIVTIGHNIAMVIYPWLIGFLDRRYGWQGALLILGAINFNMCVCAMLMQPRTSDTTAEKTVKRRVCFQSSVFKKSSFLSLCFSNVLCNIGFSMYMLLLPSYMLELDNTKPDNALVISILVFGIGNSVGKIVYPILAQIQCTNVTLLYASSLALSGLWILLSPLFTSSAGLFTLPGVIGFFYSVVGALVALVIFSIVGDDRFADGVGLSMPFKALGNFIGGPLGAFVYELSGDYSTSIHLSGVAVICCAAAMIQPIVYHFRKKSPTIGQSGIACCLDPGAEKEEVENECHEKMLSSTTT